QKLCQAQFNLEANGYASHQEWKQDWLVERSSQFFVLGSKDESAGCQGCQAALQEDGSLSLTLRLPDALVSQGKYLTLTGIRFAYGHGEIVEALNSGQRITAHTKSGEATVKRKGTGLSIRLVGGAHGWRVLVRYKGRACDRCV